MIVSGPAAAEALAGRQWSVGGEFECLGEFGYAAAGLRHSRGPGEVPLEDAYWALKKPVKPRNAA
jgi:hypothetical protein